MDVWITTEFEYNMLLEILPFCLALRTLKIVLYLKDQNLHTLAQSIPRNRLEVFVLRLGKNMVVEQNVYWELIKRMNLPVLRHFSIKWNCSQNDEEPLLYLIKNCPLLEYVAVYSPTEKLRKLAATKGLQLHEYKRYLLEYNSNVLECINHVSHLEIAYVDRTVTSFKNASDIIRTLINVKDVTLTFSDIYPMTVDSVTALIDLYYSVTSHANLQSVILSYGDVNLPERLNGILIDALYKEKPFHSVWCSSWPLNFETTFVNQDRFVSNFTLIDINVYYKKIVSLCNRNKLLLARVGCDIVNGDIPVLLENIAMHDLMLRHAQLEKRVRRLLVIPTKKYSNRILLPFIRRTADSEMWSKLVDPELPSRLSEDVWECIKKYFALCNVKFTPNYIKSNHYMTFLGLHGRIITNH